MIRSRRMIDDKDAAVNGGASGQRQHQDARRIVMIAMMDWMIYSDVDLLFMAWCMVEGLAIR
eukprot:scaffold131749_cov39-Cyclotella_meneghiniana.AAC.1